MAGGGYRAGQARGAGTRSVTVRRGTKSETKVNAGVAKMAAKMLPSAAKPIRPRGAAASLRPRVARQATAGTNARTNIRAQVTRRGKSKTARSK
jgi:hypothetical protein